MAYNPDDFPSVSASPVSQPNNPYQNPSTFKSPVYEEHAKPPRRSSSDSSSSSSSGDGITYSRGNQNQNQDYFYDPYNIQYKPCTVDQWQQIQSEPTDYSKYWDSPESFQPDTFTKNTKKQTKCNDAIMAVLFLIVFLVSIAVFAYNWYLIPDFENPDIDFNPSDYNLRMFDQNTMWKFIGVGLAIALVFNIVHSCFIFFLPVLYIKVGLIMGVIVSILGVICPMIYGVYGSIIFPILMLVFSICFYCMAREYIEFSAAILKQTCKLLCKYPSVFLLVFLQMAVEVGLSVMYSLWIYAIEINKIHPAIYIFVVIAYFWTTITLAYIIYMAISGVASSWYFLNDTEYMPRFPVLMSFKRAITTSLGSAAFAGLILAIVQTLKLFVNMNVNGDGTIGAILSIIRCIALCLLSILECFVKFINRYALIYCATFGVPYREGCRRFLELNCTRYCDLLMNSCIIFRTTEVNMLAFSIGACLTGYGIGYGVFGDDYNYAGTFVALFAFAFAFALFEILSQPFIVISDTLLVCFVEAPEQLKTSADSLYELLKDFYGEKLHEKLR